MNNLKSHIKIILYKKLVLLLKSKQTCSAKAHLRKDDIFQGKNCTLRDQNYQVF